MIWAQIQGRLMDRVYLSLKARNGGVGKPEFRLPLSNPLSSRYRIGLTCLLISDTCVAVSAFGAPVVWVCTRSPVRFILSFSSNGTTDGAHNIISRGLFPISDCFSSRCVIHDALWLNPLANSSVPISVGQAGMIGNFQTITTYLIDAFTMYAASALAAATCLRSLCG